MMSAYPGGVGTVQGTFTPAATPSTILCCLCGTATPPNATNMCVNCVRNQIDVTEGIAKHCTITYCTHCGRYLQPPKHWVKCDLESKELLTFCIKRIKGMGKVKLVDAGFIWTEPHSKRLKLKLTIQKEVMNGAILQQTFVVEFVVEWNMCLDCNRANTQTNAWKAAVQLRQHVDHKRTFMFLEQLILKHSAHEQCINIKAQHEGVDFYFANRNHGQKFIDFLQGIVPAKFRHDRQLVSHDTHTAEYNYKYTFSVEIVPICKDDLVCLPPAVAKSHGQIGPVVLCTKVSNAVALMDPLTMRITHLDSKAYWNSPFGSFLNSRSMIKYVVLDCEVVDGHQHGKWQLADVQVVRESDLGTNDTSFSGRTHMGALLKSGDTVLGYDLARHACSDANLEAAVLKGMQLPDFILVRKCYEEHRMRRRREGKNRAWKLKRMAIEAEDLGNARRGKRGGPDAGERDSERFLEELEEDPEMRQQVAMYKDPDFDPVAAADAANDMGSDSDDDSAAAALEIPLEDLLDDLDNMRVGQELARVDDAPTERTQADDDMDLDG